MLPETCSNIHIFQFNAFQKGFDLVTCNSPLTALFRPEELEGILIGQRQYDWNALKESCSYDGGFNTKHPTIVNVSLLFKKNKHVLKCSFFLVLVSIWWAWRKWEKGVFGIFHGIRPCPRWRVGEIKAENSKFWSRLWSTTYRYGNFPYIYVFLYWYT